jgi:MoxR-like ATPase
MPHEVSAEALGIELGEVVRVTKNGRGYMAVTTKGVDVTDKIASHSLKNAFRANKAIELTATKNNCTRWSQVPQSVYDRIVRGETVKGTENLNIAEKVAMPEGFETQEDIVEFVKNAMDIKPAKLKIKEVWWKFAVRAALRGKNLLVVGPTGCGKTLLANALKSGLGREDRFFYVNLGGTQDPRSTLIGNTHYDSATGTYVALSYFAKAIQVPGAIILLDEASRAHPEAHNILMPVLDHSQRYMRVDEKADSQTIHVAAGVTFILTANVGSEYTATRTMDRALLDRCVLFEMNPLELEDELANLTELFPNVEAATLKAIAEIACATRSEVKSDQPKVDTIISTRQTEEMAGMVEDGFTLGEAAETCVYPFFNDAGGAESPRAYVKQLVQKYLPTELDGSSVPFQNTNPNGNRKAPWD